MTHSKSPMEALDNFLETLKNAIILPLHQNMNRFHLQRQLRESKRFQEMEAKLSEFMQSYNLAMRYDVTYREKIVEALQAIEATRMTQFLEKGRDIALLESAAFNATLEPYISLLKPIEDIRRLQLGLLSQAKLKRMPIAYDEIMGCLNTVSTLVKSMQNTLEKGLSDLSEKLARVA